MPEHGGRVAVVTGVSSGIGAATAKALAASQARVLVTDADLSRATEVARAITDAGGVASPLGAPLSSEREVARIVEAAVVEFGGLDILVNIPSAPSDRLRAADGPIIDLDADLFDEMLNDQLVSFAMAVKHAVRHLPSGGVIVSVAHVAGMQAHVSEPMLGSSQAGVIGLTRNVAAQYGQRGIRAVCVSVGGIPDGAGRDGGAELDRALERHSVLPWPGQHADVANLINFLASDDARFITGVNVPIDGGLTTHFPNWAEMVLA